MCGPPLQEVDDATIHGLPIPTSPAEACDPRRMAVLIYDMQVGLCQQVPCGSSISEACVRLRDRCRAASVPVAYSRHLSLPSRWMGAFQPEWRWPGSASVKPWFLRGTSGAAERI